jgi:hypothetical protein
MFSIEKHFPEAMAALGLRPKPSVVHHGKFQIRMPSTNTVNNCRCRTLYF